MLCPGSVSVQEYATKSSGKSSGMPHSCGPQTVTDAVTHPVPKTYMMVQTIPSLSDTVTWDFTSCVWIWGDKSSIIQVRFTWWVSVLSFIALERNLHTCNTCVRMRHDLSTSNNIRRRHWTKYLLKTEQECSNSFTWRWHALFCLLTLSLTKHTYIASKAAGHRQ